MVLEETLTLNNIDDVKELTWTFLDAGIKVRISQTMDVEKTGVLIGKIQDFRALFIDETESGVEPYLQESYELALTTIEETAEGLTAIMDKYDPGDVLDLDPEEVIYQPFEEAVEQGKVIDRSLILKTAKEIRDRNRLYSMLCLNELAGKTDDGTTVLHRYADPDRIKMSLPIDLVDEIENERCVAHDIQTKIEITTLPICHITFGTDALAGVDLEEIDDLLPYMNPDIDTYDTFCENYSTKQIILGAILDCLSDQSPATAMEVLEKISKTSISSTELGAEITIVTDFGYVKEALSDMQKAKLIKRIGPAFKIV